MIGYIIFRLLKFIGIVSQIEKIKSEQEYKFHKLNASFNHETILYPDAKIINLQNNSSKIKIGSYTHIRSTLLIFAYGGEISIGNYCYIGDNVRIWSGESIIIGNDVIIGHNSNIIDTNSHEINKEERQNSVRKQLEIGYQKEKGNIQTAPIVIGDNVWISFNVAILKGVTIGEGAIIAANSVVTKDVKPYSMVAGNPAIEIKNVHSCV